MRWMVGALGAAALLGARPAAAAPPLPPLDQIVREARSQAPSLVSARGAVGVARSTVVGARLPSVLNPSLDVRYEHGFPPGADTIAAALALPVEVGGQRGRRIDEANALVRWQEAELGGAEARVVGEAVATYGEVLVAAARLREAIEAEEDARQQSEWFTKRLQAGDVTLNEQSLAESELGRWAQLRAEASVALTQAATRLAELTGQTGPVLPGEVASVDVPGLRTPWAPSQAMAAATKNPDVRARALEASHWDFARQRFEAERTPPLSFIVTAGRGDLGEPRVGGGIGWSLPVARRNQGEIARAVAESTRAANERASLERVVAARMNGVHAVYDATLDALRVLDATGLPAARRAVDAAVQAQRAGKVELVQVLIAKRDLAVAITRRLDLVATAWRAYGELTALKGELP